MPSFGRYTLVRRVGTGGMAEIWKAKVQGPAGFEKVLAIKKVLPHLAEDPEFIQMFVEEAKLVATLVHPNIVQVFDFGQVGKGEFFIAMEYVSGTNLAMMLRRVAERGSRMPGEVALYVGLEICKGLGYAHGHVDASGEPLAIIHRDISPQNILLSYGGEVKITDFGIAKVASALTRTAEGHVRGKLAYMSPEQAETRPLDNRSDLFSLGVVLYELLTGRRLFYGSSASEIFARVTGFHPPAESDLPQMPSEVKLIIRTALQPDPAERYQDAMELEHALTTALGPDGIVQARHALASIIQRLFEEERKLDLTSTSAPEDRTSDALPTVAVPTHGLSAGVGQSVIPQSSPAEAPTTGSGLTLVPSSVKPVPAVKKLPTGSLPQPVQESGAGFRNALTGLLLVVALGTAALVGAKFLPPLLTSANPTPFPTLRPTPTPLLALAPTPTTAPVIPVPTHLPRHTGLVAPATPVPASGPAGSLTVMANPWVYIYVDEKKVSEDTLKAWRLPPGTHRVRFVNPPMHFDTSRTVTILSGVETKLKVDTHQPPDRAVTRE